ncbi:MAG: PilZ domain-containing protein [Deltaproteobacteria bacterium]|nr:PilZ domain-containing protein [Deltaproteobacteria bacterium]
MTNTKAQTERRRHKRFQVQNGAFVVLTPSDTKVGRIMDINMNGLAFHYIGTEEPSNESTEISIFSGDCGFYLYRIPCETVVDLKAYASHSAPISIRRCSVQFGDLTPDRVFRLEHFIHKYTEDEVESNVNYMFNRQRTDTKQGTDFPLF